MGFSSTIQSSVKTRLQTLTPFTGITVTASASHLSGASSLAVEAISYPLASGIKLTFSGGATFTLTSAASVNATTLVGSGGLSAGVADEETATADLATVDVISEDLGDIANKIDKALAKTGVFVLVMMPTMQRVAEPTVMDVTFNIDIAEEPILNRTGAGYLTAETVAENVHMALNNFGLTSPAGLTRIRMADIFLQEEQPLIRYRTRGSVRTKIVENIG